jgi:hypothetical protein
MSLIPEKLVAPQFNIANINGAPMDARLPRAFRVAQLTQLPAI